MPPPPSGSWPRRPSGRSGEASTIWASTTPTRRPTSWSFPRRGKGSGCLRSKPPSVGASSSWVTTRSAASYAAPASNGRPATTSPGWIDCSATPPTATPSWSTTCPSLKRTSPSGPLPNALPRYSRSGLRRGAPRPLPADAVGSEVAVDQPPHELRAVGLTRDQTPEEQRPDQDRDAGFDVGVGHQLTAADRVAEQGPNDAGPGFGDLQLQSVEVGPPL